MIFVSIILVAVAAQALYMLFVFIIIVVVAAQALYANPRLGITARLTGAFNPKPQWEDQEEADQEEGSDDTSL